MGRQGDAYILILVQEPTLHILGRNIFVVIVILKSYDLAVRMTNRATGHIAMILEEQYGFELFTLTSFAPFIETKLENMGGFVCR